jgi:hypothetical protein
MVPSRGRLRFKNILNFRLLAPASGLRGQLKQKVTFFLRKRIVVPSPATHIKLVAIALIALHHFSLLPSSSSIAFIIHYSMADTLFMPPLLPLPRRLASMTQGTTPV